MSAMIDSDKILRWGILSAGKISHDWAAAFRAYLKPEEHQLIGIAARDKSSAIEFSKIHEIPNVYDSYEELCRDPSIDVVYIGSVHPAHLSLCKMALDLGKHVLCEKPLCINVKETKELVEYAKKSGKFLMEAVWSRFFPAYVQLRKEIEKGTIGEILQVNAGMGVILSGVLDKNWREWDKSVCGGSVLDIGTYTCQFASFVYNGETPSKIIAGGQLNSFGVDESSSATLIYSNGKTATLQTHFKVDFPNEAYVIGTKGMMKIGPKFWCPTRLVTPDKTFEYELPHTDKNLFFWNTQGLAYQCDEVRNCILSGLKESPVMSLGESILLAQMREEIRKQIGVVYEQDD